MCQEGGNNIELKPNGCNREMTSEKDVHLAQSIFLWNCLQRMKPSNKNYGIYKSSSIDRKAITSSKSNSKGIISSFNFQYLS